MYIKPIPIFKEITVYHEKEMINGKIESFIGKEIGKYRLIQVTDTNYQNVNQYQYEFIYFCLSSMIVQFVLSTTKLLYTVYT